MTGGGTRVAPVDGGEAVNTVRSVVVVVNNKYAFDMILII